MFRPLMVLVIAIVIVVAGLFLLAGRARDVPVQRVEKAVSLANLAS